MAIRRRKIRTKLNLTAALANAVLLLVGITILYLATRNVASNETHVQYQVDGCRILKKKDVLALTKQNTSFEKIDIYSLQNDIASIPVVENAVVTKVPPNIVSITVKERTPYIAILSGNDIEYIDRFGVSVPQLEDHKTKSVPVLNNIARLNVDVREETMRHVVSTLKQFEKSRLYDIVSELKVSRNTLFVTLNSVNTIILLNLKDENSSVVKMLSEIIREKVAHYGLQELAYIDGRFKNQMVLALAESASRSSNESGSSYVSMVTEAE